MLVGLQTGGVPLARPHGRASSRTIEGHDVPVGTLDVAFYRDDIGLRPVLPEAATDIPLRPDRPVVVLVDDVLFTGRTVRAALNALSDYGRARAVQLAVMVDRGHRELPIRPDYVGQEPAHPPRRDGRRQRGRGGHRRRGAPMTAAPTVSDATCCRSPTSARDGIEEVLRVADSLRRGRAPGHPQGAGPAGQDGGHRCSSRSRPGPGCRFETAAKRLSADVLSFSVAASSVKKGESLRDTVETIEAMGVDALVVRHPSSGVARPGGPLGRRPRGHQRRRRLARAPHPGPARLLHHPPGAGRAPGGTEPRRHRLLRGAAGAIVGDIRHSRVARSEVLAFTALGAEVTLVAPGSLLPPSLEGWPVDGVPRPRRRAARGRRGATSCGCRPSGGVGAFVPVAARVHRAATG